MLVPREENKLNLKIYKHINLLDLLYIIISLLVVFLTIWNLPFENNIIKLVIIAFLSLPLVLLTFYNNKHKTKYYTIIWRLFNYSTSKKKIIASEVGFPYFVLKDKLILKKKVLNRELIAYEIIGKDISILDADAQDNEFLKFEQAFNKFNFDFTIVKTNETSDLNENEKFFKNSNFGAEDIWNSAYVNDLKQIKSRLKKSFKFYIVIYKKENSNDDKLFENEVLLSGFKFYKLDTNKLVKLLFKILFRLKINFNNLDFKDELEIDNHFNKLLKNVSINIKQNSIVINNKEISIKKVHSLPFRIEPGWARYILENSQEVIWHVNKLNTSEASNLINRTLLNSRVNKLNIEDQVEKDAQDENLSNLHELSRKIVRNNCQVYSSSILLISDKNVTNRNEYNNNSIKLNSGNWLQLNYFK
ncbi:hypothetical protein [Mycoplasma testudineum]|uniref:hypothetical protein n=1 Tax=Mycoplasma testudineum TaxID=244584 RepID=UPI000B94504D|nr:hypothetical protein [Mycoplasma testudineum]OYD26676.1 hypothetical protein CG473_02650 [Mycoplasma testudineum]